MNFIDKLEQFLLRPRAKVYFSSLKYSYGDYFFCLGSERRNYGKQDKECKKEGIISMMNKLRDNSYKHPEYTHFHLDLIGGDYFNDILALEPTNDDLINLYLQLGYGKDNTLNTFLYIIKDKDYALQLFKYGHYYKNDRHNTKQLKTFVTYIKKFKLNDDEWIDVISTYLKNSIGISEKKEDLIEVCIDCIKDNEKCEKFIKEYFQEDINFSEIFNHNTVTQLKINSKNIIKNFGYNDDEQAQDSLKALYELFIKFDIKIDYYNNNTDYNFILYNESVDKIEFLIQEMLPVLKNLNEQQKYKLDNGFDDIFLKKISYFNMQQELPNKEKKKNVKI